MSRDAPPIGAGFCQGWCDTLAVDSESPPEAFLASGLALLSACLGPRLVMRWGASHEERCNLWMLNVGMSALARKTSGLSGLRAGVGWTRAAGEDLVRMTSLGRLSDAGLVAALDVVGPETERARAKAAKAAPRGTEPEEVTEVVRSVPLSWVVLLNEVSPVWQDDGPTWAMDAQRALLSIYDGRLSSSTRATAVVDQECCVTALGNIPPGVLRSRTSLGMLSSGFVGRWLVVPTPAPVRMVSFPSPNGADPLGPLRADVAHLMWLARSSDRVVVNDLWDTQAIDLRHAWYAGHWRRYAARDAADPLAVAAAELFGRQQATALKLATLGAVGRQASELYRLADVRVEAQDVEWANGLVDASMAYVIQALSESGASDSSSPAGQAEGRVLRALARRRATSEQRAVSVRDLAKLASGHRVSSQDVARAVDTLLQVGELAGVEVPGGARTRRLVWIAE